MIFGIAAVLILLMIFSGVAVPLAFFGRLLFCGIYGAWKYRNVCNECVLHFELYFYVGDSAFYSRRFFD